MKIIIDKLKSDPDHSLSKKDITTVLKHVPKDWFGPANIFRLTSLIFKNSTWPRIVIYNAPTYFIMSRGFEKNEVIKEFLIELAISATIGNPRNGHFLDKTQRKKLEEIIEPFRITITSELKNI